ncbi:MAG TPA: transglutaminase-like domain-containing protein [Gemmatimonadales bacterium]|nr:transglutaminase-like domain-containing protein [Gemmatimonadales bacterium]
MILAAWAAALFWLIQRQYFGPAGTRPGDLSPGVSPGAQFYRLSLGAQQLGYASTTVDTLGDSIRLVDVLVLDLPSLGRLGRNSGRSVTTLDRALRLLNVTSETDGAAERYTARGALTPDNVLRFGVASAGDSGVASVAPGDGIELPSLWPLRMAFGRRLRRGRHATIRVLDPFTLELRTRAFRVTADSTFIVPDSADFDSTTMAWVPVRFDTVRAVRIDASGPGDGPLTWWVDAQGYVVRGTLPLGFTIERTAFELAYENFRRRDTLRLMRASASPGPGTIVPTTLLNAGVHAGALDAAVLRVRLGGGALEALDLVGGRQRLDGDTLTVRRESGHELVGGYSLPHSDSAPAGAYDADFLVTSADRRIRAEARQVAGVERDPAQVAAALTHWVARTVRPEPSTAFPQAAAVLIRRTGDCNEHTVLYVALARALGLPARPVAGLLLVDGRYYYHAWAEVYLGDWVAVDPTLDQFPADVAHLRLIADGLARPTDLAPRVGRLTIDTL